MAQQAPHVTKHGYDRARQRIGVPKRAVERLAGKAMEEGLGIEDFTGAARGYLISQQRQSGINSEVKVYHGFVFMFCSRGLITTWPMPKELAT